MTRVGQSPLRRDARGVGLRLPHIEHVLEHRPEVDYFEVISENYLGDAHVPLQKLLDVAQDYDIVLHGVGLNLLGHAPLSEDYLDRLCRLADRVRAPFVTDHLCWTGAHGINHHDLLPVPYTEDLVGLAAERACAVQRRLDRPFGLENLSSYLEWQASTMGEAEFYRSVVMDAGCHFMLDINNVYVSSQNHNFDAQAYLDAIEGERVLQIHLSGHTRLPDGLIIDTHDRPVCDAVLDLYRGYRERHGPRPTLLEWDEQLPTFPELQAELARITAVAM